MQALKFNVKEFFEQNNIPKQKYIADAIVFNGRIGKHGVWLRCRDLTLVKTENDEFYTSAFGSQCPLVIYRIALPYQDWMEPFVGECEFSLEDLFKEHKYRRIMFKRDYKIVIQSDNNDESYWELYRKGEKVTSSKEELQMVSSIFKEFINKIDKALQK